jgi:hypothetical protein
MGERKPLARRSEKKEKRAAARTRERTGEMNARG